MCTFQGMRKGIDDSSDFLQSLVGPFISSLPRTQRLAVEYLGPLIAERRRLRAEHANNSDNWQDKPVRYDKPILTVDSWISSFRKIFCRGSWMRLKAPSKRLQRWQCVSLSSIWPQFTPLLWYTLLLWTCQTTEL